ATLVKSLSNGTPQKGGDGHKKQLSDSALTPASALTGIKRASATRRITLTSISSMDSQLDAASEESSPSSRGWSRSNSETAEDARSSDDELASTTSSPALTRERTRMIPRSLSREKTS